MLASRWCLIDSENGKEMKKIGERERERREEKSYWFRVSGFQNLNLYHFRFFKKNRELDF